MNALSDEWKPSTQKSFAPRCNCGQVAEVHFVPREARQAPNQFVVWCRACGALGPEAKSIDGAVSRWTRQRDGTQARTVGPLRRMSIRS